MKTFAEGLRKFSDFYFRLVMNQRRLRCVLIYVRFIHSPNRAVTFGLLPGLFLSTWLIGLRK